MNTDHKILDSHFMRFIGVDLYQPNPHGIQQIHDGKYVANDPFTQHEVNALYKKVSRRLGTWRKKIIPNKKLRGILYL